MKDICLDVYFAGKQKLNPSGRRNSYELLGFDFMIDEDFRVWLIEVNTNPSLALNNKRMKHILPNLFKDIFRITMDVVFNDDMDQESKDR